ncbi:tetratricopeptide repeat protein [Saccharopolyspora griseoalba]|uniref:NB-ARC domain-containing protein n=1 Tax=Saccharopolyspora griseoalba TaxID=1431848 RepID=A0ABW2LE43_9PSEU
MADRASNAFDGEADNVVQVGGDLSGGVHYHLPRRPKPAPAQVPPPGRLFVNNETQLAAISCALRPGGGEPKVVVVRGAPGGGKSETVYQWVSKHRGRFPDGLFYARLSAGAGEAGLESAVLRDFLLAVGYESDEIPTTESGRYGLWQSWSCGKRIAVVVDDAIKASQVRKLRPGEGDSAVLVTEAGPLSSLRVDGGVEFVPLDPLAPEAARELITGIVGRRLDPAELDELIRLCDGYTIALCAVAAGLADAPERPAGRWIDDLSRQGRRLKVLSRDEDQSVRAVFNTVLDRLGEEPRQVYAAFGQHPGRGEVSLGALAAACERDLDEVRDAAEVLCRARLVRTAGADRYLADGLVREHARAQFPDDDGRQRRFQEFYLRRAIAEGWAVQTERGWLERLWGAPIERPSEECWTWLTAERANLRAVARELHAAGSAELCRMAVALWPFHDQAKHVDDMDVINRDAAEVATSHDLPDIAALALVQRGFAFRYRGEHDKAVELFGEAARRSELPEVEATAVESMGLVLRDQGDPAAARDALRRNLRAAERLKRERSTDRRDDERTYDRRIALACMHLGSVEDLGQCWELFERALSHFTGREAINEAKVLRWRGRRGTDAGRHDRARADLTAALEAMTQLGKTFDRAQILCDLGENASAVGDLDAARERYRAAAELCQANGYDELGMRARAALDGLGG